MGWNQWGGVRVCHSAGCASFSWVPPGLSSFLPGRHWADCTGLLQTGELGGTWLAQQQQQGEGTQALGLLAQSPTAPLPWAHLPREGQSCGTLGEGARAQDCFRLKEDVCYPRGKIYCLYLQEFAFLCWFHLIEVHKYHLLDLAEENKHFVCVYIYGFSFSRPFRKNKFCYILAQAIYLAAYCTVRVITIY